MTSDRAGELLKMRYGDDTDKFIKAFKSAYPEGSLQDMVSLDMNVRSGAIETANVINSLGDAPVYIYLFAWKSPVMNGTYGSCHNMELPFMFNNVALQRELTGSVKEAYEVADRMSSSWINFTRHGNPNGKGAPGWDTFAPETNATMIFSNKCVLKRNHDREMLDLAAAHPAETGTAGKMIRQILEQLRTQAEEGK